MTKTDSFGNHARFRFLTILAVIGIGACLLSHGSKTNAQTPSKPKPPPVYSITDPEMINEFTPQPKTIQQNFDLLLATAGGSSNPALAWKKWIKPGQRIGIKICTIPGKIMSTRPALVDAIVASLLKAGYPPSDILIFDRYTVEMQEAGWVMGTRPDRVTVTATWPLEGYDRQVYYNCPYAGRLIWGDLEFKGQKWDKEDQDKEQLSNRSYFSKIVTDKVDVIINVPVLTNDSDVGVFGCIVNLALGAVDNQRRFFKPFFGREENIADLATQKTLHSKWVLNILDGILGQYAGGPPFDPNYVWPQGTLWLSEDPVALDTIAINLINQRRPLARIKPIDPDSTSYIQSCENLDLGNADLKGRLREVPLPVNEP